MRILFFTNEYSHPMLPPSGGVGSFLKIMSESLTEHSHEVYIYGFSKRAIQLNEGNIKIEFFKKYAKKFPFSEFLRSLSAKINSKKAELYFLKKERQYLARQLKKYCKENNINIVESFVFGGYTAFWENSIPMVTRFHGSRGFWHYYLGKHNEVLKINMEKKALEATPYTVANSHFSAQFIKNYYNVDVDVVIPNGINTNLFSPDETVKVVPKSIFYIGTISEAKGVKDLALIFNEVIRSEPMATLNLIGRGENYWNYLKTEVLSKQALKNTVYSSHTSFSEIPKALAAASVIAVPSKGETFGFTIVEAMAMEKVTIVANIPVAKEIISHGIDGFIAKDNKQFKSLILEVFKYPQKNVSIGKKARQKVLNHFTLEKMTIQTLDYYEKILSN